MLRYDLDRLGWHQFEHLCQALLKHKLGLGVEAWGGTKDWGRDAYYPGKLKYPAEETQDGPFLFQCKFVSGANSAEAKVEKPLLSAIKKECDSIERRLFTKQWEELPKVYTFLTNAVLTATIRSRIEENARSVLPDSMIVLQGADDICALIDLTTGITRRFPQILSLTDLDVLLSDCVHRKILNRSEAAIDEAKEISKVFVPTEAYSKAMNVLRDSHYVVLEGPPEVGKTAIGRMIALSYIPEGWEVIECRVPEDLLNWYARERRQIFVADDSFGRTEYNPGRVSLWQEDLPAILRKIGENHLLIMTSRKHLLEMAKEELDVPGANGDFPLPAEVLVDVSNLTQTEKSLMLYKHMKNALLTKGQKVLVRGLAKHTIEHNGFTPERIRELALKAKVEGYTPTLIEQTLTSPTGRMSKTYRELPVAHKWFMISVLLASSEITPSRTQSLYQVLCPPEEMLNFDRVKTQLSEAFIKPILFVREDGRSAYESICWVHPSCGDMVGMELSDSPKDRMHFLANCDISGLKYAVSVGGGEDGRQVLPLLKNTKDWTIFRTRCNEEWNLALLNNISDSVERLAKRGKHEEEKRVLEDVLREVTAHAIEQVNAKGKSNEELLAILKVIQRHPNLQLPRIEYKMAFLNCADSAIALLEDGYLEWHQYTDLDIFVFLSRAIMKYDPRCFGDEEIQNKWQDFTETLFRRGKDESSCIHDDDPAQAEELYESYDSSRRLYEEASTMMDSEDDNAHCIRISESFVTLMEDLSEYLPHEPDYDRDDDIFYDRTEESSIEEIFKDL